MKMSEYTPLQQRNLKRDARRLMKEREIKYTEALRIAKNDFEEKGQG